MAIYKYMFSVYGKLVMLGKRTLDETAVTDDCKLVPKEYIPYVAEWIDNYNQKMNGGK